MKKQIDENFKIPLQGKYLDDILDSNIDYDSQTSGSANAKNQIADNVKRKK